MNSVMPVGCYLIHAVEGLTTAVKWQPLDICHPGGISWGTGVTGSHLSKFWRVIGLCVWQRWSQPNLHLSVLSLLGRVLCEMQVHLRWLVVSGRQLRFAVRKLPG